MIFQTFALIVKQYFSSFSFPLRPCRKKKKNCCIFFCQQEWKRNVKFRGRGNSQAQSRSWSLHNVLWLIFPCHPSAHTGVKNRQLNQWGKELWSSSCEKGISIYCIYFLWGLSLPKERIWDVKPSQIREWPLLHEHHNNNLSLISAFPGMARLKTPGFNTPILFQFWRFYI